MHGSGSSTRPTRAQLEASLTVFSVKLDTYARIAALARSVGDSRLAHEAMTSYRSYEIERYRLVRQWAHAVMVHLDGAEGALAFERGVSLALPPVLADVLNTYAPAHRGYRAGC